MYQIACARTEETGIRWTRFETFQWLQMLCCCWKGNLNERKQEEGLEGQALMKCWNGYIKTSIMMLQEWQKTGRHGETRETNLLNRRLSNFKHKWRRQIDNNSQTMQSCKYGVTLIVSRGTQTMKCRRHARATSVKEHFTLLTDWYTTYIR